MNLIQIIYFIFFLTLFVFFELLVLRYILSLLGKKISLFQGFLFYTITRMYIIDDIELNIKNIYLKKIVQYLLIYFLNLILFLYFFAAVIVSLLITSKITL